MMRRMLPGLRNWREANHRKIVELGDDRFVLSMSILLALVPALLALLMVTGGSTTMNAALIFAMGAIGGLMLGLTAIRNKGQRARR